MIKKMKGKKTETFWVMENFNSAMTVGQKFWVEQRLGLLKDDVSAEDLCDQGMIAGSEFELIQDFSFVGLLLAVPSCCG